MKGFREPRAQIKLEVRAKRCLNHCTKRSAEDTPESRMNIALFYASGELRRELRGTLRRELRDTFRATISDTTLGAQKQLRDATSGLQLRTTTSGLQLRAATSELPLRAATSDCNFGQQLRGCNFGAPSIGQVSFLVALPIENYPTGMFIFIFNKKTKIHHKKPHFWA